MRNYHADAGCVFDTLAFFTAFLRGHGNEPNTLYYQKIKNSLNDKNHIIPSYLCPFFTRPDGRLSFMDLLLFDGVPYGKCGKDTVFKTLKNTHLVFSKYIEHYFHGFSARTVQQRIARHPDGIDMVKKASVDPSLEMYVYYSLVQNDEVMAALYPAFELVYTEMENAHSLFASEMPGGGQALDSSIESKLRAISGAGDGERLRYSFTLMEPRRISCFPDKPTFFLLGRDYESVLETEYKYIGATPYSFALAIGNPAKHAIYQALLKKSPMTRAELEKTLHLSRSALDHNLRSMREVGLVVMSERRGDAFYYTLDAEFIQMAAERTLADAHLRIPQYK